MTHPHQHNTTPSRCQAFFGLIGITLLNALVLTYHLFSHKTIHSVDGMYHIRYAWLYREHGLFTGFPWMQHAITKDTWADHHFLYHLMLLPFAQGDLLFGMKLSAVVFGTLALSACTLYLIAHRVRFAWVYGIVLLLASDFFLFRVSMPRSISLSLIFLLLALWCLEQKHHRSLFAVAFAYIWTYQTAVVILPMAVVTVFWWRWQEGVWAWRPLLYAMGGIFFGLTLHPFVPDTFSFFAFHFSAAFPSQHLVDVPLIPEWRGTTLWMLLQRNYPALLMGLVLPLFLLSRRKHWPRDIGVLCAGTLALWVVSLRAERMLEYGVAFAVLLGARLFDATVVQRWDASNLPFLASKAKTRLVLLCGTLLLLSFFWFGIQKHQDFHRYAFDIQPHVAQNASRWLKANTPARSIVYHTDWAGFSYLFFHNTHNHYIAGLSPLFLAGWKPRLFQAYQAINQGRTRQPARWIQKLFRARYVVLFAAAGDAALAQQFSLDPLVKEVYADAYTKIFEISAPTPTTTQPTSIR